MPDSGALSRLGVAIRNVERGEACAMEMEGGGSCFATPGSDCSELLKAARDLEGMNADLRDLIKDLLAYKRDEDSVHLAQLLLDIRDGTYVPR